MDRRTQVVLGETEEGGFLRFVLEGEGFDVVGLASSDQELDRVLPSARPAVIVVDAGISALAALRAKKRASGSTIVVVWPDGVAPALADERLDPSDVVDALGPAVRRAALRAHVPEPEAPVAILLGKAIREWRASEPIRRRPVPVPRPMQRVELPRRAPRRVLLLAATWLLILTALASIATGIPRALEGVRRPVRSPATLRVETRFQALPIVDRRFDLRHEGARPAPCGQQR